MRVIIYKHYYSPLHFNDVLTIESMTLQNDTYAKKQIIIRMVYINAY